MTNSKKLPNFPTLPVISDAGASVEERDDCPWTQILFIALSATLWFSIGVLISVSVFMPKFSFAALIIICAASLMISGMLYYFYMVNKLIRHQPRPVPVKVDKNTPLLAFRSEIEDEDATEDFHSTDADVVNLLGGLFSAKPKQPKLPSSAQD